MNLTDGMSIPFIQSSAYLSGDLRHIGSIITSVPPMKDDVIRIGTKSYLVISRSFGKVDLVNKDTGSSQTNYYGLALVVKEI